MTALKKWPRSFYKLNVTAVISEEMCLQDSDNPDLHIKYCPPCDAVMNVSLLNMDNEMRDMGSVAAIVEQSDFCVFDFSATPHVEKLKQSNIHSDRVILLDIGKTDYLVMERFDQRRQRGKRDG